MVLALAVGGMALGGTVPAPVPTGPYLNGAFPSEAPGTAAGFTTVNAFPNLRFIGPLWVTPYPGTDDLVVVGKSGHVWRFENRPDVLPSEVTVMLNLSKYGDGVDLPENVLPDATHTPAVVADPRVPSAPDMAFYQLVFHPDLGRAGQAGEHHVYASYSYLPDLPGADNDEYTYFRVSRFTVVDDPVDGPVLDPGSEQVLIDQFDRNRNHQGGAMFFGDDGFLYISTGDGGFGSGYETAANTPSQRLDGALMGGILRIDVDMRGGGASHPIRRHPDDSALDPSVRPPAGWPASFSGNYYIPSENPWVDPDPESGVLEEFWGIGLRSPHSMQRDAATGGIWIGDVGGSAEEIHLARAGDNFQWRYVNGGGTPKPDPLIGIDSPAILTIPRSVGTCVIGGFVYRGDEFPGLVGKLLYGDHVRGTVSALDPAPGEAPQVEFLCDFSRIGAKAGLANFCPGPNGEVFMPDLGGFDDATDIEDNDGTIQRLVAAATTPEPPGLLSQTGAFADLATLTPDPAFLPYEPLAPLWSDAAVKSRWIALPNDGRHNSPSERIVFHATGNWAFPAGTVLMKHFELPDDEGNPASTVRLETRFIVCTEGGGKYGVTYRWLPDQSDAVLLTDGATGVYPVREQGGGTRMQAWSFPGRSDCLQCHNEASGQALGLRAHALNGSITYPGGSGPVNQLAAMSHRGMFDRPLSEAELGAFAAAAPLGDHEVPLEHRVRSYLDMNCAHCHQPGAPGGGFDARLATPLLGQALVNQVPGMFADLGPDGRYIKPMDVAHSVVHHRMDHALPDPAAMPPLAKNVVDEAAVQAVADWIQQLDPADFPPDRIRSTLAGPETCTGDFVATLVLDDDIAGLEPGGLAVANGRVISLQGSGHWFRATVRPMASPVSVSLPSGVVSGAGSGLPNRASNTLEVTFADTVVPVAKFTGLPVDGVITGRTVIGLGFGKDVTGLSHDDFAVSNGSIENLVEENGLFRFDLVPGGLGVLRVDLRADAVTDGLGRGNPEGSLVLESAAAPAGPELRYLAGLDVWLDASDIDGLGNTTLADGSPVVTWLNKGNTGVTDAVSVGGTGTLVVEGGDGVQDAVALEDVRYQFGQEWADSADVTIYFVVYQGANSSGVGTLLTDYGDVAPQLRTLRAAGGSAGAYLRDADGDTVEVGHGPDDLAGEEWAVLFHSFDSATGTSTWGELGNTLTGTNPDFDAATTFEGGSGGPVTLFGFHDGNDGHDFNGLVSEVLIYDHLLDAAARAEVERYLEAKVILRDIDGDGIGDAYELVHTDPPSSTALVPAEDDDADGLSNLQEFLGLDSGYAEHGFGATLASVADSDGDGIADGEEVTPGHDGFVTDPRDRDTDGDGMVDFYEVANHLLGGLDPTDPADGAAGADLDGDGLGNLAEHDATPQTRADKADTDDDGYGDAVEDGSGVWGGVTATGTDPVNPDSDGDGLLDGEEHPELADHDPPTRHVADPNVFDSDGDSHGDGEEVAKGSDPNDPLSIPPPPPGIVLRVDFHRQGDAGQEVQDGWLAWDVDKGSQPASVSRTIGSRALTVSAGGGGYLTSRGPSDQRAGEFTGTSWNDVVEELIAARGGDGTVTLEFSGLDPATPHELTVFHNDPYTIAGNPGFATGDGVITPGVTTGTMLGSVQAGVNTNIRPGTRSDADFLNSVVRFTPDASGLATILLASTTEFVVLDGILLENVAGELVATARGFNEAGGFEVRVAGLDRGKRYVLKRSVDLADGFPDIAAGPFTPASGMETLVDPAPPSARAFYRIEEVPE